MKARGGQSDDNVTPLPKMQMAVAICVLISEASCYGYLFPFVPFLVRSFGDMDEEDVGFYSGWIASFFMIGQFLSSFFWGYLSDYIGIRPVILFGTFCNGTLTVLFGFSKSLEYAMCIRLVSGILNGNIGVVKTFIGLISDETNEAVAFGAMALCWGFGSVIGPALSGLLSEPAVTMPGYFTPDGLFGQYPYLLASMATATIPLLGFFMGFFHLKEPSRGQTRNTDANKPRLECLGGGAGDNGCSGVREERMTKLIDAEEEGGKAWTGHDPSQEPPRGPATQGAAETCASREAYTGNTLAVEQPPLPSSTPHAQGEATGGGHAPRGTTVADEFQDAPEAACFEDAPEEVARTHVNRAEQNASEHRERRGRLPGRSTRSATSEGRQPNWRVHSSEEPAVGEDVRISLIRGDALARGALGGDDGDDGDDGDGGEASNSPAATHQGQHPLGPARPYSSFFQRTSGCKGADGAEEAAMKQNANAGGHRLGVGAYVFSKAVLLSVALYSILRFSVIALDDAIPLFMSTPRGSGGMGFNTGDIGWALLGQGIILVLHVTFIFPILKRYYGPLGLFRIAGVLCPIAGFLAPSLSDVQDYVTPATLWVLIQSYMFLKASGFSSGFTSVTILINNSAPRRVIGSINGVSQTAASLVSAMAPAYAGNMFSLSLQAKRPFPFDFHFVFYTIAAVSVLLLVISYLLPPSIQNRFVESAEVPKDEAAGDSYKA